MLQINFISIRRKNKNFQVIKKFDTDSDNEEKAYIRGGRAVLTAAELRDVHRL